MAARAREERIAIAEDSQARKLPVRAEWQWLCERFRWRSGPPDRGAGCSPSVVHHFTNPAGLITQALQQHTSSGYRICDTPAELFHRIAMHFINQLPRFIANMLAEPFGMGPAVTIRGEDATARL